MYLICIGHYYKGDPHTYAVARTLKDAAAYLRSQGYRKRKNDRYGIRAYFEHDEKMQWARVIDAPLIGGKL
jgi:orotate phosphoribosyltransferase